MGIEGNAGHFVNKKQEEGDREHVKWYKRETQDEVRERKRAGGHREERRRKPEQRPSESLLKRERGYGVCSDLIKDEHGGGGTSVAV